MYAIHWSLRQLDHICHPNQNFTTASELSLSQLTSQQNQQNSANQLVLNAAARAVLKFCKYDQITPILKSLHWLKIRQWIQYKVISVTYNSLETNNLPT